ncbi:global transcription factor group E4 [Actinidia rufa]|uniref:Global transcription factor group E4 n=1 Tax=Actinidia rufa TaxID=165716 RepID=A0A7J0FJZ1_9ERIC|nr:global transcription factor group E4 [Actinidia rufa]
MASGTIIGGNGGGEGSREKQRWAERKVYSRKSFKGLKTNDNSNAEQPQVQTLDSPNSSQQQLLAASDDSSSSRKGNGAVKQGFPRQENRVTIHLTSRSKQEMREVRRKLKSELDLVRNLVKKIEGKEGKVNGVVVVSRPLHQLSVSVLENSQGGSENVEKEKRTPKANQFYHNSEFLLAKDKFPPADSAARSRNQAGRSKQVLNWDMVDPEALGLRDYLDVIKHPMDLGTVKSRLNVNWYKSPREFADDVRLTFSNAMIYNPKGQDVHVMAEQLSTIFEEKWAVIEADYTRELKLAVNYEVELPTPTSRKIIKKRTISLCQKDDEIEVDIDIVDTETLWELDRFATNYKKSLSKNKNKSEIPIHTRAEAMPDSQEKNPVPTVVEAPKETKSDEKNVSSSSPVQLEKPVDNASRSSSSSSFSSDSGSSSSGIVIIYISDFVNMLTDSDSESSSGDGSDAGHSPKT